MTNRIENAEPVEKVEEEPIDFMEGVARILDVLIPPPIEIKNLDTDSVTYVYQFPQSD